MRGPISSNRGGRSVRTTPRRAAGDCACIEAGKTLPDAIAELREAVDFLRYYAAQARRLFGDPLELCRGRPESATSRWDAGSRCLRLHQSVEFPARDIHRPGEPPRWPPVMPCSRNRPSKRRWSPFAPFELLLEAGVPPGVLHFLPGDGATIGGRATLRSARGRCGVYGFDRDGSPDQPGPGGAGGADCDIDRRDRRPERDVRGQLGAARAGGEGQPFTPRSTVPDSAARRCASFACRRTSRIVSSSC